MAAADGEEGGVGDFSMEDVGSGETPIPAAEVLVDLRESARRRRGVKVRTSPRKRTPNLSHVDGGAKKTSTHLHSSRRLDFSDSSSYVNTESSDEDKEEWTPKNEAGGDKRLPKQSISNGSGGGLAQVFPVPSQPRTPRSDQSTLQIVSSRLRNLLKLPKAHKWCYYEWFYSDIDQPLLEENDFCRCLSEMFPDLKTRSLTRVQWRQLRRMMGKPRRCSPTFFAEERGLLEYRRSKVRQLQQQVHQGVITVEDFAQYKDLPDEIPALLVLGTPVTARLHSDRERESGFYTGKIEAVDFGTNKYWVTFDRPGVGKHLIHDTEIKSAEKPEMVCISSLESSRSSQWPPTQDQPQSHSLVSRPLHQPPSTPPRPLITEGPSVHELLSPDNRMDPFLTASPGARRKLLHEPPTEHTVVPVGEEELPDEVGGFPVAFLRQITQLSKLLQLKQQRIIKLTKYNTEIEKMQARLKPVGMDFQHKYAKVIIDLDDINKQLNLRLEAIKCHCDSMGCGAEVGPSMDAFEHAQKITESSNTVLESSGNEVKDPGILSLITRLTGLLLQIEGLSDSSNSLDLATLTTSLSNIEAKVQPQNRKCFQTHVETPVTLIQAGMSPIGPLHAFSVSHTPSRTPH